MVKINMKQKTLNSTKIKLTIVALLLIVSGFFSVNFVQADTYDDQIKAIEKEIDGYDRQVKDLRKRASTLAEEVRILESQKNTINKQLKATKAELERLKKQIKQLEQKIAQNRDILGDMLVKLYINEQIGLLERIASSKNIADFIDNEAKLKTVRYGLNNKIKEIKLQKKKLKEQQQHQNDLLRKQQEQKRLVIVKEQEKNNLLAQTKNDQMAYQRIIKQSNKEIAELREQQRLANLAKMNNSSSGIIAGDPNKGGYPANLDYPKPMDSIVDPWGMYNRECVSYTAWKVHQAYLQGHISRDMPYWGGHGNAKQWPWSAQQAGIPTGGTPRPKSVAIWTAGTYGHAMWVEHIKDNGMVHVSQYNINVAGMYSEMDIYPDSAIYIYF